MGVIPEFCVLIQTTSSVQAEHELIRGLRQVIVERKEVFWVTFAIQVFLDMRNVLREDVERGFAQLCRESRKVVGSINETLHYHQDPVPTIGPHETSLRELIELIERWTEGDFVGDQRRELQLDPMASIHIENFHLLKRDPLLCGLLLYNFRMVAYHGSIILANNFFSIQATAHLYNSLRQTKLLSQKWIDMEYVLSAHETNEIFVGDVPRTALDCYKQALLAYGVSPREFARNKRPKTAFAGSPANAKKLHMRVPLGAVFKSRLCDDDKRSNFVPKDLVVILQSLWHGKIRKGTEIEMCTSLVLMAETLHREAKELTFDYFLLHKVCRNLLSRLVHDLADTNDEMRFFRSNPKYVQEAVGCLLGNAACAEKHLRGAAHRANSIECPFCRKGHTTASGVAHHLETGSCPEARHLNRETIYQIIRQRDTQGALTRKLLTWSSEGNSDYRAGGASFNGRQYECYLWHRGYGSLVSLNQHLSSPTHKQKIYHCISKKCGKEFTALAQLFNHLESESCGATRFATMQRQANAVFTGRRMIAF